MYIIMIAQLKNASNNSVFVANVNGSALVLRSGQKKKIRRH